MTLDQGTYEVLRDRLAGHAGELARRARELNDRRLEVFGGTELRLVGTERIRTEHNCVPRDIVSLGGLMLFGYNVFIGLKPETAVDDVFSLHRFALTGDGPVFERLPATGPLGGERFERDFAELYRYYREAGLMQLRRLEGRLLAVFRTGPRIEDIRVLRWAVGPDGDVEYLDNKGEREHAFPPPHDFEWTETTRDDHVPGRHPHISIGGEVFVETVGGTLTVKVEDNTETGAGIFSEPVNEPLQSLGDADVRYARVGTLILLRIRPYNEPAWRHLVFDTRTRDVARLDGIGQSCRRLPEDHGVIFPGGYYLAGGGARTFDTDVADLEYERTIRSPNGEDVLYVFHARAEGRTLLLPYNVIRKQVGAPMSCHGHSLFDDGTMVVFRADSDEPTRVHPMQVWQTPYVSDTHAAARPAGTGPLERIGNADLVRGISDCLAVARTAAEPAPSTGVFEGLIAACARASDHYHWLGEQGLAGPLGEVRATAERVLDEFETVQALTAEAAAALDEAAEKITTLVRRVRGEAPGTADAWVTRLAGLRREQGHLETLRELRYMDLDRLDEQAGRLAAELDRAGRRAIAFLQGPDAFAGYHEELDRLIGEAGAIGTVAEAAPLGDRLAEQAAGLETVTEVAGSLDTGDATVRTRILERIGEVAGELNRARAVLAARRRELLDAEGRAGFAAEFALLAQEVTGALAAAGTPEQCDERLGRLMLRLEDLESRFAEFDDFLAELAARREDVHEAFSARRQALLDERARRADRLAGSAERILAGVRRRLAGLGSPDEVNTYFATDPMVAKLREVAEELRALGDPVRAGELDGRIKAARQEAGRALRDRTDLVEDGGATLRLGRHRFAVSTRPTDLTLVPHAGGMTFAITGTDYRAPVRDAGFEGTRPFWDQPLISESPRVYRSEHLAAAVLAEAGRDEQGPSLPAPTLDTVRAAARDRYDEGYEQGVHDHDASLILDALLGLYGGAGLLRYPPAARAAAQLFWAHGTDQRARDSWARRAASLARARARFGAAAAVEELRAELAAAVGGPPLAGEYLFEELAGGSGFVTSAAARALLAGFHRALGPQALREYQGDLRALGDDLDSRRQLVEAWLGGYLAGAPADDLPEAVALELCGTALPRRDCAAPLAATVEGLLGAHPRISGGRLELRLDETLERTREFRTERVPAYRAYRRRRTELVERERERLRIAEYRPGVLGGFVRNRLLDEVYLPLIGDNLAKQLGAAGEDRQTDRMGLLLLISPPGYGKTTLLEYVAGRLGLVLVKVNGPALGHEVTSLDPARAPDAAARREVEKISFALEMGNNVLLYLDDIQHTSPELLQKFVSLCDAQRRIEGVRDGQAHTYDLRGKRFAVCMAGNPYTESGTAFQVPDMLANRADVWNLGDVLSGRDDLFALSYVENALTANPVLAPLSARPPEDVRALVGAVQDGEPIRPDRLAHPYSPVELEQITAVLRRLVEAREVVLAVNRAYIASAAQPDASRTEPPFLLQGSYRNMNRLAERIVPVMDADELAAVIDDHYRGEAQALASGAEANLLKLAELRDRLTPDQARRWAEVKAGHLRARALGGDPADPVGRAVGAVDLLADRVGAVEKAIDRAAAGLSPAGRHRSGPTDHRA
ncbi:DNA repair ATPase [Actinomadura craniellae]|uniref:DNA repair ATPase n=1 Tax=Actinomadura craniellae TaxID=2231787 RepID=A0A365H3S5_9ACTN|nr:DNA repair ATPase [Actinomadura craniellae]RAY13764.1 DNA repair ATPase [Actinomadura craniellae]